MPTAELANTVRERTSRLLTRLQLLDLRNRRQFWPVWTGGRRKCV